MKHWVNRLLLVAAFLVAVASGISGAGAQVHDNAGLFSPEAVADANRLMSELRDKHRHEFLVETYKSVPADLQSKLEQRGKEKFFGDWAEHVRSTNNVSGVVMLICMDPKHVETVVGNETRKSLFTMPDRQEMQTQVVSALKEKEYDKALTDSAKFVTAKFECHDPHDTGATGSTTPPPPAYTPTNGGGSGSSTPGGYTHSSGTPGLDCGAGGMGGFICLAIGVVLVIVLLRAVFHHTAGGPGGSWGGFGGGGQNYGGGGGPGYGPPPMQGGYNPGYGYPPAQCGGGFGSGFLGGLLGGAVGGYAEDRFMHPGGGSSSQQPQQGGYTAPSGDQGGGFTPDTSSSGGGADFGVPDSGSSSSDFGSSSGSDSGGSDSGSSGGGGDFGGGGGGDSGSSGSDF